MENPRDLQTDQRLDQLNAHLKQLGNFLTFLAGEYTDEELDVKVHVTSPNEDGYEETLLSMSSISRSSSLDSLAMTVHEDEMAVDEFSRINGVIDALRHYGTAFVKCVIDQSPEGTIPGLTEGAVYRVSGMCRVGPDVFLAVADEFGDEVPPLDEGDPGVPSYFFEADTLAALN